VQKIMLDTNQYDRLPDAPETYGRLRKLQSDGKIELLTTHIKRDELSVTNHRKRRVRLEALLASARLIGTRGAILDMSRCDLARLGDDEDQALIEHIRGRAWERKNKGALIAATAAKDADLFVTNDKLLTRRLESYPRIRCEIMNFEKFERHLANLTL